MRLHQRRVLRIGLSTSSVSAHQMLSPKVSTSDAKASGAKASGAKASGIDDLIKPKVLAGEVCGQRWFSFRWRLLDIDWIKLSDGRWFIQFGKNPIKFIARGKLKFLVGANWQDKRCAWGFTFGKAKRPFDMKPFWRKYANWTKENNR